MDALRHCGNCKFAYTLAEETPCKKCISLGPDETLWEPDIMEIPVIVGYDNVQDEIMGAAISYAKGEMDIDRTLDWIRQILEQNANELLDEEDEEDLLDGDLEDQFDRLMK